MLALGLIERARERPARAIGIARLDGDLPMLAWLQRVAGLAPERQIAEIEEREPTLEERLERLIGRLGAFRTRRPEELEEIMADLDAVLDIVEKLIITLEHIGGAERARRLRTRLRNNRTRAGKALEALKAAS